MAKTVDESGVGISCFVSSLPNFRAVLKHGFLTTNPDPLSPPNWNDKKSDIEEFEPCSNHKDYTLKLDVVRTLCSDADVEALGLLLQQISSAGSDIFPIVLSLDSDESHRAVGL